MADDDIATTEHRTRWRTIARWTTVAVPAVVAGIAAISIVRVGGDVGPGRVTLDARWGTGGGTTIAIPPLGDVSFDTHGTPLVVHARIDEIDPRAAQELALDPAAIDRFDESAPAELRSLLLDWVWRALLVAAAAGAVAGALTWPRHLLPPLVGAGVAGGVVLALVASTWIGFSRTALRDPEYHGALERAPEVLAAIDRNWGGLEQLPGRLRALAENITELTATVGIGSSGDVETADDEVRILHISDVHSNPLGLELARGLVEGFDIDAVVDTGDLTSFGLPVEAEIGRVIVQIPVPYYFVPGNHDTRANRAAIAGLPNVTLLDGDVVEIGDVRLLGVADPAITADGEDSDAEANAKRDEQAASVASMVSVERPDVLAVATTRQARASLGHVPLVIAGNTHKQSQKVERGTRILTVGSTGATGIGVFTLPAGQPYEAQILRFRGARLTMVDYVVFEGVRGDYTVSRRVVEPLTESSEREPDLDTNVTTTTTSTIPATTTTDPAVAAATTTAS